MPSSWTRVRVPLALVLVAAPSPWLHASTLVLSPNGYLGSQGLRITVGSCSSTTSVTSPPPVTVSTLYQACDHLEATLEVQSPATVDLRAGSEISFKNNFEIQPGAELRTELNSSYNTWAAYLQDASPSAEDEYYVTFYANFDSLTVGTDQIYLFEALDSSGDSVFRLRLEHNPNVSPPDRLRLRSTQDNGTENGSTAVSVGSGWNRLSMYWKASSSLGADDGELRLYINGSNVRSMLNRDTDTLEVSTVKFGAIEFLNDTATGSMDLDNFDSKALLPTNP